MRAQDRRRPFGTDDQRALGCVCSVGPSRVSKAAGLLNRRALRTWPARASRGERRGVNGARRRDGSSTKGRGRGADRRRLLRPSLQPGERAAARQSVRCRRGGLRRRLRPRGERRLDQGGSDLGRPGSSQALEASASSVSPVIVRPPSWSRRRRNRPRHVRRRLAAR